MAKLIRVSAKNVLKLSDKAEGTIASFPALPLSQNNQKFYLLTIPVQDIFPFCFVSRREEDPSAGFQRILNEDRADDIAKYLDNSKGSIPTNIVLSAQADANLTYTSESKTLKYSRTKNAFLVLDGQHRLYGYGKTTKPHRVPVAIYEGLSRREEARLFIDINTNQKGVPAALLLDIQQLAEMEDLTDARLRVLFDKLSSDQESPLNGFLVPHHSAPGRISRVAFRRSVGPILSGTIISRLNEEKQYELLRNYLRAVNDNLQNPHLLRKAAYFEAFCDMFEKCRKISKSNFGDMKPDHLSRTLDGLANIDLGGMLTRGRTKITKKDITEVLKKYLAAQIDVDESMV